MAEQDSDTRGSPPVRPFQFSLRSLLLAATAIALVFGVWKWIDKRIGEPQRRSDELLRMIDSLAMKRPSELTRGQWALAVGWTHNLHCNSLLFPAADLPTIRRFEKRLRARIEGDVDMATIDWIWEQYADMTSAGQNYQRFRERSMLPHMETVGPNEDPFMLNVP